jgi:hypothetical protein
MNTPFPHHAAEQAKLREASEQVMERIRERNAMRMAEVAIAKAAGKFAVYGWPVLTGGAK